MLNFASISSHLQKVYVHGMMVNIDRRMQLQEFHIGQERGPAHAEKGGENYLISGRNKGKVNCLHAGPINNADLVGIQELIANLQRDRER